MMIKAKAIIAVPFYNEVNYLDETLRCLAEVPSSLDLKFFLCDNNSIDGSSEVAKRFSEEDSRFVYHGHSENLGAVDNFRFSFENSASLYFMWLGGHDVIDRGYPAAAIKALDEQLDIAYAAAVPLAFKNDIHSAAPMKNSQYRDFASNRLTRYLQSVSALANCTIVNSMFRREYLKSYSFRRTISMDHVLISHLLWHGPIQYVDGHHYYRRFFDQQAEAREEKLLGKHKVEKSLPAYDFVNFYIDDFRALYRGSEPMSRYLEQKIMSLLEQRWGTRAFDAPQETLSG